MSTPRRRRIASDSWYSLHPNYLNCSKGMPFYQLYVHDVIRQLFILTIEVHVVDSSAIDPDADLTIKVGRLLDGRSLSFYSAK